MVSSDVIHPSHRGSGCDLREVNMWWNVWMFRTRTSRDTLIQSTQNGIHVCLLISRWYLSDLPTAGCGEPRGIGTERRDRCVRMEWTLVYKKISYWMENKGQRQKENLTLGIIVKNNTMVFYFYRKLLSQNLDSPSPKLLSLCLFYRRLNWGNQGKIGVFL